MSSPNDVKQQVALDEADINLIIRKFALSNYGPDDVEKALVAGWDPNIQWSQADLEGQRQTGVLHGYNPEKSWANYNTPLHMSVQQHQFNTATLLLQHGAQINQLNALGRSALHEAIFNSDTRSIEFLIENGADLNVRTEARSFDDLDTQRLGLAGILPLHEALRTWNHRAAELLIAGGADLTQTSPGGWTILDLALLERNEWMMILLYKHGARFSEPRALEKVPAESLQEMAQVLLEDINIFPPSTCRPVYLDILRHSAFTAAVEECSVRPYLALGVSFSWLSTIAEKPNPENGPGAPKCIQCVQFVRGMSPHMSAPFKLHSNRAELVESALDGCCLCAIFEDALVHHTGKWARPDKPLQDVEDKAAVFLTINFTVFNITITVHCEQQREAVEVYGLSDSFIMSQDEFPDDTALGTASPRAFKTAHAWLENCQRHHSLCGKEETTVPVLPTRVIDVGDDSTEPHLHIGNGERAPYLALSYCQDSSSDTITTIGTLQAHMDSIILSSLPLTLREAILATRELGFRFLWVDVLCIIQDNTSDRERETQQMTAIYANAILTLSAHDSGDLQGGLYRPRKDRITSPVQISLRAPKRYQAERLPHQRSYYVLPVHGEKELFSPGPVDTQAWTLQQQLLSTRILHWGPGILFWECLSSHGSESDPEGHTHPYNSSCTNFMDVRHRKRIVQGRAEISDLSYHKWTSDDGQVCEPDDSDEESESPVEEIEELIASRQLPLLDEENPSLEAEAKGADESDIEDEDPETNEEPDLKKITYLEWQKLVSQYSALALPKPTDKIPAFLGLSEIMARTLEDEFVIGVWKKSHFLPSLLWAVTKPGGRSRNENYPSWTWASVDGKVHYPVDPSRIKWEPSMATLDVQVPSAAQDHGTGSIVLRSTMRKFPKEFKFWRYENFLLNPLMTYAFGRSNEWRTKSSKELQEQLLVVEGSRDLRASSGGWEGAGNEIYCLVIAHIGATPPPNVGHPAFLGGRPKSLVCLCLTPVRRDDAQLEWQERVFRRVGLCHFWDTPVFWKEAAKEELVTII